VDKNGSEATLDLTDIVCDLKNKFKKTGDHCLFEAKYSQYNGPLCYGSSNKNDCGFRLDYFFFKLLVVYTSNTLIAITLQCSWMDI